jgi:hypothetical protein
MNSKSATRRTGEPENRIHTKKTASVLCIVAGILLLAGCSNSADSDRPSVYEGGAYYGDAVHPAGSNRQ